MLEKYEGEGEGVCLGVTDKERGSHDSFDDQLMDTQRDFVMFCS